MSQPCIIVTILWYNKEEKVHEWYNRPLGEKRETNELPVLHGAKVFIAFCRYKSKVIIKG
jgi:hypothetical protein